MKNPLETMEEIARELGLDYEPAPMSQPNRAIAYSAASKLRELGYEWVADAWKQPAQQEPFGYFKAMPFGWTDCAETDEGAVALYERPPPQRTWQRLTDEEIDSMVEVTDLSGAYYYDDLYAVARAVEKLLKAKNEM